MVYALLVAALVAIDQAVKFLVRTGIPLHEHIPFIPYILDLTYVQNTGAAFSMLSDHTWFLALISAVVAVGLAVALVKGVVRHPFGVISLSVVLAGAIGNLIDRVWLGYVVDMFNVLFMKFAVFNVADICVVCGGIAICIYVLFFYEKWEKKPTLEETSHGDDGTTEG